MRKVPAVGPWLAGLIGLPSLDDAITDIETLIDGAPHERFRDKLVKGLVGWFTDDEQIKNAAVQLSNGLLSLTQLYVLLRNAPKIFPSGGLKITLGRATDYSLQGSGLLLNVAHVIDVDASTVKALAVALGLKGTPGGGQFLFMSMEELPGGKKPEALVAPKPNDMSGYGHLSDRTKVEPGRAFTPEQKEKIREANRQKNGGKLMSDDPNDPWFGKELQGPGPRRYGGDKVPDNEAQIDHIVPKTGLDGKPLGTNDYSNAQVISAEYNNFLRNKKPKPPEAP